MAFWIYKTRKRKRKYGVKEGSFITMDKCLNDVTTGELDRLIWNESWDVSSSTRRDYWKTFHAFYEWAAGKKCEKNIVKDIAKPKANVLDPEAFTVEQAENILKQPRGATTALGALLRTSIICRSKATGDKWERFHQAVKMG